MIELVTAFLSLWMVLLVFAIYLLPMVGFVVAIRYLNILSADEWGFCRAVQTAEDEIYDGNAFTNSVSQESVENHENTSISAIQNDTEELQYKSKKNQTFIDSIDIPSGKRFNVKNIFDTFEDITMELLTTHSPVPVTKEIVSFL